MPRHEHIMPSQFELIENEEHYVGIQYTIHQSHSLGFFGISDQDMQYLARCAKLGRFAVSCHFFHYGQGTVHNTYSIGYVGIQNYAVERCNQLEIYIGISIKCNDELLKNYTIRQFGTHRHRNVGTSAFYDIMSRTGIFDTC